jgi:hypothetical protein
MLCFPFVTPLLTTSIIVALMRLTKSCLTRCCWYPIVNVQRKSKYRRFFVVALPLIDKKNAIRSEIIPASVHIYVHVFGPHFIYFFILNSIMCYNMWLMIYMGWTIWNQTWVESRYYLDLDSVQSHFSRIQFFCTGLNLMKFSKWQKS